MQYHQAFAPSTPYSSAATSAQRNAGIWSHAEDEILLQARASGLNWQPIASRHFPNKTPNACRKRHERLIERRHVEDWDSHKLDFLAQEYLAIRKEMWEMLAERVGERWQVVEAKVSLTPNPRYPFYANNTRRQCMEKGLKTLQATTRMAARKASVSQSHHSLSSRGISPQNSDSGIGLGSDTEMEAAESLGHMKSASWDPQFSSSSTHHSAASAHVAEHYRSRSLPQPPPLPLYQPPPPPPVAMAAQPSRRTFESLEMTTSPDDVRFPGQRIAMLHPQMRFPHYVPPATNARHGGGGLSIQSVLAPSSASPQRMLHRV